MNKRLKPYIQIVEFLGKVLGKNFEIILHDLENLDGSVVASANSTRKIGDSFWGPISSISDRISNKQLNFEQDYIINYDGLSKTGEPVKFSTFFIKDENNKTIGLLGINADYSDLETIKEKVDSLLNFDMMGKSENKDLDSIEVIASNIIDNTISEFKENNPEMSLDRKLKLIEEFNRKGVFLVKGTVQKIAKLLDISEPSIYRYLSKIKDTGE
jgi:predicted transcriptional regulator YheO